MAVGVSALCSLFDCGCSSACWFLPDCDSAGLKQALPSAALPGSPCRGAGPRTVPAPAGFPPESPALSPRTDTWARDAQPGRGHTASRQAPRSTASFGDSCGLWLPCGPLFFAHTVFQTEILRSDSLLKCISGLGTSQRSLRPEHLCHLEEATASSLEACPCPSSSPGTAVHLLHLLGNLSWCLTRAEPRGMCAQGWLLPRAFMAHPCYHLCPSVARPVFPCVDEAFIR